MTKSAGAGKLAAHARIRDGRRPRVPGGMDPVDVAPPGGLIGQHALALRGVEADMQGPFRVQRAQAVGVPRVAGKHQPGRGSGIQGIGEQARHRVQHGIGPARPQQGNGACAAQRSFGGVVLKRGAPGFQCRGVQRAPGLAIQIFRTAFARVRRRNPARQTGGPTGPLASRAARPG
ncbi:hypothetical protein G6F57_019858 [Rhizopus arrhizus]|nr:hypothetical protein G6F57_019858 [Rhizopus arrhizus]